MNFAGLEAASKRVKQYAVDFTQYDAHMYSKTKDTVMRAVQNLVDAIRLLDQGSRSQSFTVTTPENITFELDSSSGKGAEVNLAPDIIQFFTAEIADLKDKISKLTYNPAIPSDQAVSHIEKSSQGDSTVESDQPPESQVNKKSPAMRKISKEKKAAMKTYYGVFKSLSHDENVVQVREAQRCTEMINHWLRQRFSKGRAPERGYNIRMIPKWVDMIILAYGNYIESGRKLEFEDTFTKWCNDEATPDNPYAIPYFIYQYSAKDMDKWKFSKAALGIMNVYMRSDTFRKLYHEECVGRYTFERGSLMNCYRDRKDDIGQSEIIMYRNIYLGIGNDLQDMCAAADLVYVGGNKVA